MVVDYIDLIRLFCFYFSLLCLLLALDCNGVFIKWCFTFSRFFRGQTKAVDWASSCLCLHLLVCTRACLFNTASTDSSVTTSHRPERMQPASALLTPGSMSMFLWTYCLLSMKEEHVCVCGLGDQFGCALVTVCFKTDGKCCLLVVKCGGLRKKLCVKDCVCSPSFAVRLMSSGGEAVRFVGH